METSLQIFYFVSVLLQYNTPSYVLAENAGTHDWCWKTGISQMSCGQLWLKTHHLGTYWSKIFKMFVNPLPLKYFEITYYGQTSNISNTLAVIKLLITQVKLDHHLSALLQLHIFILDLTAGFNGLGKDNCMRYTRWEILRNKFGDLVWLIIEVKCNLYSIISDPWNGTDRWNFSWLKAITSLSGNSIA